MLISAVCWKSWLKKYLGNSWAGVFSDSHVHGHDSAQNQSTNVSCSWIGELWVLVGVQLFQTFETDAKQQVNLCKGDGLKPFKTCFINEMQVLQKLKSVCNRKTHTDTCLATYEANVQVYQSKSKSRVVKEKKDKASRLIHCVFSYFHLQSKTLLPTNWYIYCLSAHLSLTLEVCLLWQTSKQINKQQLCDISSSRHTQTPRLWDFILQFLHLPMLEAKHAPVSSLK